MSHACYFGAPQHMRGNATSRPRAVSQAGASADAQARCDAIQAEFRTAQARGDGPAQSPRRSIRRDPPPRPAPLTATEDALLIRLSQELGYAARMIEQMGDALSADPIVVARHMVGLQSVDIVCQLLGHVAKVIESGDRDEAVARIGMEDLRARLLRKGSL